MTKKFMFLYAADIIKVAIPDTPTIQDVEKAEINPDIDKFEYELMGFNETKVTKTWETKIYNVDEEIYRTRKAIKVFLNEDRSSLKKLKESKDFTSSGDEDDKTVEINSFKADPNPDPLPPGPDPSPPGPDPYDPGQVKTSGPAWIYGGSRFELTFLNTADSSHK
jgi:hypothetical protein